MTPAAAPLVSVHEYLSTSYEPDVDYVDGRILERNVGEKSHGRAQLKLVVFLHERRRDWEIEVFPTVRMRVSPKRYRVPDVSVFVGPEPDEQIFTVPPFLCAEVLSPEDRVCYMMEKIDDYLAMGVRFVWIIDPAVRRGWVYTSEVMREAKDGVLRTADPEIAVPIAELFD